MGLPEPQQDLLYETRWSKIEGLFRGFNSTFDAFARDYIALRTKASKQEKSSNVYRSFRDCFDSLATESGGLEPLLDDLLRLARYYAAFSFGHGVSETLRGPIARLSRLVDVPAILVMRLFDCCERRKSLSEAEFVEGLQLLESYVLRRSVCSGQTRGYWQIFADLAYRLDLERPLHSLKGLLAIQHESYAFPTDAEFSRSLAERDLYHMRNCLHVLEQLENHGSREPTDTRALEIEHILPQNERLNAAWRGMLGPSWREVQQRWLHRLGNLTLTGYNSTYSDRSFADKKSIKGGFSESAVRLNKYVREQAAWTEREMEERTHQLVSQALQVWPALEVDAQHVRAMELERLRERASKRDVASVAMSETARSLFETLSAGIRTLDAEVTEMAEGKSVSYHCPYFFLEVLPRKNRLTLLLPINYSDLQDAPSIAADATEWQFIVHAKHSGGVLLRIKTLEDIEAALPLIRQAHAAVRTEP
jgi:predicted transport protein